MMQQCPGLQIPRNVSEIDTAFLDELYAQATAYLKTRVGYLWEVDENNKRKYDVPNWTISVWSRQISYGFILKYGTEEDKDNLPPP
jgi:hypothetical protein